MFTDNLYYSKHKTRFCIYKLANPAAYLHQTFPFPSRCRNFTVTRFNCMILKNKKFLFLALIGLTLGYIIYDSASLPTAGDLKGNFKELAVYRNENNTGPIVRVYAVSVEAKLWEEMRKYGDMMPYTKYGSTMVYFFDASKPTPNAVQKDPPHFEKSFNASCLAVYSKDANGAVTFEKSPL